MAGLQNIDMEQIDAALVDDANGAQGLWYVIIPGLRHVLTMITSRGGPARAPHVIGTFTYLTAFRESYVGYGAALAIVGGWCRWLCRSPSFLFASGEAISNMAIDVGARFQVARRPLKSNLEIAQDPLGLPPNWRFENIVTAWNVGKFGRYFINSVITTVPIVILVVSLSCLAGYGLARVRMQGRMLIFYFSLIGLRRPLRRS